MTGYNFGKCMGCEYFCKNLHCCSFTVCIKSRMFIYKNGKVIEINLEDLNKKPEIMKEGKVYSSTGLPTQDGIFSHTSLTSPLFKEWKYSPEIQKLKDFERKLAIQILRNEFIS